MIAASLAASGYVGWVAYLRDGGHVFEARPKVYGLAQLLPGQTEEVRPEARQTREWRDLPHAQVDEVELYAFHEAYTEQPIMRITRQPGNPEMRFIQMKMRGLIVPTGGTRGTERTGLAGYRIGYWNPARGEYDLVECTPRHRRQMDPAGGYRPDGAPPLRGHPCWPRPHGFGLAPQVVGTTADKVPSIPQQDTAP